MTAPYCQPCADHFGGDDYCTADGPCCHTVGCPCDPPCHAQVVDETPDGQDVWYCKDHKMEGLAR